MMPLQRASTIPPKIAAVCKNNVDTKTFIEKHWDAVMPSIASLMSCNTNAVTLTVRKFETGEWPELTGARRKLLEVKIWHRIRTTQRRC